MLMKNEKNKRYELLISFYNRFSSDTEAVMFFYIPFRTRYETLINKMKKKFLQNRIFATQFTIYLYKIINLKLYFNYG